MTALSIPNLEPDVDILTAALAYGESGWYVLPTNPAKARQAPRIVVGEHWQDKSSRDPKRSPPGSPAPITESRCTAADPAPWCSTSTIPTSCPTCCGNISPQRRTSRPGLMFPAADTTSSCSRPAARIGNSPGRLGGAWGEIRGLNGVIIAAPTPHPEGGRYRWERT